MVINRELFVRGWLPAGLVINARLLTNSTPMSNLAVLKPVINPVPGSAWPSEQAQPVFPIEQATDDTAIVLVDPFETSTLALLPLGKWYGPGTPYILAVNTWYEGRVRLVSGSDVMAVRITAEVSPKYYSDYKNTSALDVSIRTMASYHLMGRTTEQVLALDDRMIAYGELGYAPKVSVSGKEVAARVLNLLSLSNVSFAGMRTAYSSSSPSSACRFVQCSVTAGKIAGQNPKFVGLIPSGKLGKQKFYVIGQDKIAAEMADIVAPDTTMGTVARGHCDGEQIVHYN